MNPTFHFLFTLGSTTPAVGAEAADSLIASIIVPGAYLVAAVLFVFSLKWLSHPKTARRGVHAGEIGMALAVIGTLLKFDVIDYQWVLVGIFIGSLIGAPMAIWMPMTAVPQRTALSHAFGALAATLVGTAHYFISQPEIDTFTMGVLSVEVLLGSLTFTGSLVAFGKLQEWLPSAPMALKGQNFINFAMIAAAALCGVWITIDPGNPAIFLVLLGLATVFGVCLVMPIGGADMPTVISLLNAYAGLSASMMGFVLGNKLLIVAGALDGSSGLILSIIMCKAMNRSFANVLFGRMGTAATTNADDVYAGKIKSVAPDEIAMILESAQRVVVVPGYGMAVSHAQNAVRDLYQQLTDRGVNVEFAIHPVAGRMPGHMNVLLAEVDIPYEKLVEMEVINPQMPEVDVAIVLGANDVVNPDARNENSAIAGMPIIDVDKARTVVVIKRSLSPGFAGIPNPLFALDNTLMYFADGKKAVMDLVNAVKELD
ncbi:MAG: NAD(P)(+) transhydrogenase (Re/Si-specific) subunit beta [Phycisphaerales bacterium]